MMGTDNRAVLGIVLAYAIVAGLWILLSDRVLFWLVADPGRLAQVSAWKGLAFVAVTAGLLAVLLKGEFRKREAAHAELDRRVVERTAELADALRAAESSDRAKAAFLATMSHELRTPLNSIIGFTGTLLQGLPGPLNDEQRRQLVMANASAHHLLAVLSEVLDLSRLESEGLVLANEPFDPVASVRRAADLVQPRAVRKGLAFEVQVDEGIGPLAGDEGRFGQIVLNLLDNAVKFTDSGAVRLHAGPCRGRDGRAAVRVRVSDTGVGIAAEDLPRLFRPFGQLDSGLSRRHEGSGLGLALCQRLAGLMGGTLAVESRSGKGSVFTLEVPADGRPMEA